MGKRLISAGHDISDGGLLTSALEMAFAGNVGIELTLNPKPPQPGENPQLALLGALFAEEVGLIMEVESKFLPNSPQIPPKSPQNPPQIFNFSQI